MILSVRKVYRKHVIVPCRKGKNYRSNIKPVLLDPFITSFFRKNIKKANVYFWILKNNSSKLPQYVNKYETESTLG